MKVGTIHTPATKNTGYPFYGQPVDIHADTTGINPPGMAHANYSPAELGLTSDHPVAIRPDLSGGTYTAALFPMPETK